MSITINSVHIFCELIFDVNWVFILLKFTNRCELSSHYKRAPVNELDVLISDTVVVIIFVIWAKFVFVLLKEVIKLTFVFVAVLVVCNSLVIKNEVNNFLPVVK